MHFRLLMFTSSCVEFNHRHRNYRHRHNYLHHRPPTTLPWVFAPSNVTTRGMTMRPTRPCLTLSTGNPALALWGCTRSPRGTTTALPTPTTPHRIRGHRDRGVGDHQGLPDLMINLYCFRGFYMVRLIQWSPWGHCRNCGICIIQ